MKATNLNVFYGLGSSITYLTDHVNIGDKAVELYMQIQLPCQWLVRFRTEAAELENTFKDTCVAVDGFLGMIHGLMDSIPRDFERLVIDDEVRMLYYWKEKFEEAFEREHRNLDVFTVTPKGTRNTSLLIRSPENDFTPTQRRILPAQFIADLTQAARCLVFDIPTACAFHVCRATESLMIFYYETLAKQKWPHKNKDWNSYIDHLAKQGAPRTITDRLREIKDTDRNAYMHPDKNVSTDEAKVLYDLCAGVNYYMAEEIVKQTP